MNEQPNIDLEFATDLCERICAAIKAADDKSVEEAGYMLDSNDCIKIVRDVLKAVKSSQQIV